MFESKEKYTQLLEILKSFSVEDIIFLEENDRQYKALEKLYENIKDENLFFSLVVINALLSFQLIMKGEKYWEKFSEFFSEKKDISAFTEFLTKYNPRYLEMKISRLKKAEKCLGSVKNWVEFAKDLKSLLFFLSKCMNQSPEAKTIVFAVKMYIYVYRIVTQEKLLAPLGIMIPLDSRITSISSDKGFWHNLERDSSIPLLHIDSILWVTMGLKKEEIEKMPSGLREKMLKLSSFLKDYSK